MSNAAERFRNVRSKTFPESEAKGEVSYNVKEDGLGAMVGPVGRLERMKEVVIWQVVAELLKDNFLKKLGNERKVRDRAIVTGVLKSVSDFIWCKHKTVYTLCF